MRSSSCVSCRIFPCKTQSSPSTQSVSSQLSSEMLRQRERILQQLIESENEYVIALEEIMVKTMQPFLFIISLSPSSTVRINLDRCDEFIQCHRRFADILRSSMKNENRLGEIFLQSSSELHQNLHEYSRQQAKILFLIQQQKDRIQANSVHDLGQTNFDQWIKKLALPLQRLENYIVTLKEYLQQLEELHPDRPRAQHALNRLIHLHSSSIVWRQEKQREMEIIHQTVDRCTFDTLVACGDALHLSSVKVLSNKNPNSRLEKRLALLYPTSLYFLSNLSTPPSYQIEDRILLDQILISRIRREHRLSERVLKIQLLFSHFSWIVVFENCSEFQHCCDQFRVLLPIHAPHYSLFRSLALLFNEHSDKHEETFVKNKMKSLRTCLRPHSPLATRLRTKINANVIHNDLIINSSINQKFKRFLSNKKWKENEILRRVETNEGDSILLSVIEAYCSIKETKSIEQTTNIPFLANSIEKESATSTIDRMIHELQIDYKNLEEQIESERRARQHLQSQIKQLIN